LEKRGEGRFCGKWIYSINPPQSPFGKGGRKDIKKDAGQAGMTSGFRFKICMASKLGDGKRRKGLDKFFFSAILLIEK
jgi:hypothetical protein